MIKKYSDFINESVYYDINDNTISVGDLVEVKYTSGRYGQTKTVQGTITKIDQYNGITLDDELYLPGVFEYDYNSRRYIGYAKNTDYEHGHETYVKKITEDELNTNLTIKKQLYNYQVRLVDYSGGKNRDKRYSSDFPIIFQVLDTKNVAKEKFENWMKENYPNVDLINNKLVPFSDYIKKYNSKRESDNYPSNPRLNVIITPQGKQSIIEEYGVVDME